MARPLFQIILTCWIVACSHGAISSTGLDEPVLLQSRTHVLKEGMPLLSSRSDLIKRSPLRDDHIHEVIFVLQQRNIDELTRILHDVSDPMSPNYGNHLSGEQVGAMTMNPEAREAVVTYLNLNGATITAETLHSEFITATAPISVWNKVLDTQFMSFHQRQIDGDIEEIVRAERYSVPIELDEHVDCVMNTIEMPIVFTRKANIYKPSSSTGSKGRFNEAEYNGYVLPTTIRKYYNLSGNHGSELSTQAIFGGHLDYLNPIDLAKFQSFDDIDINQPALNINGHVTSDTSTMVPGGDWGEGNLDVQYIIAVSNDSPTTYWSWQINISLWLRSVLTYVDIPKVLSISYGGVEAYTSSMEMRVFNTEALKIGVRGTTIVVASGDDGAVSYESRGGSLDKCGYFPIYPGSSPYVLSVGATSVGAHCHDNTAIYLYLFNRNNRCQQLPTSFYFQTFRAGSQDRKKLSALLKRPVGSHQGAASPMRTPNKYGKKRQ